MHKNNANLFDLFPAAQRQAANRIRVRRARPIADLAADAIERASLLGHARSVDHGGPVANSYGYPASTQAVGVSVVRVAEGAYRVLAAFATLPANKVTLSGAAARTWAAVARGISASAKNGRRWISSTLSRTR